MGLYTTTLVRIIKTDIKYFMIFFSVIFIGFCGAMEMTLKMNDMQGHFGFVYLISNSHVQILFWHL